MTMTELTQDEFLGGRLRLWQPKAGYRAGVDPVILAASVPAVAGQSVLDLGCGIGTAGLALMARVPDVQVTGVEVQAFYADLARRNAQENAMALAVIEADLAVLPKELRAVTFDHVIANPPYFDRGASVPAPLGIREKAMGEVTPLALWIDVAARRVKPRGYVTFIHRAERVPEVLGLMAARLGSLQVLPLTPRVGREAQLCLIRGRKTGRAAFRLHAGVVMHEGAGHPGDRESYTPLLQSVLKHGHALPFPTGVSEI
ncbi:MAG TPA: methyltransferase [Rhodobacteraceae bacterium]|jgi:tRNA1(Val) A37 N6-methylase TrmN6|nr:methyltransferase [Paracoccaceae bacterium]HBV55067.1 methyltransferase [Paracoccaceae bacterium]